jgi:hypothetical protein
MAQITSTDRTKQLAVKLKSLPTDVLTHITGFLSMSSLPRTAITQKADARYRPTTVATRTTDDDKKRTEPIMGNVFTARETNLR